MKLKDINGLISSITLISGKKKIEEEQRNDMIITAQRFVEAQSAEVGYQDEYGFEYTYKPKSMSANQFLSSIPSGCFYTKAEGEEVFFHYELSSSRLPLYAACYGVIMGAILPLFGAPSQTFFLFSLISIGILVGQRFKLGKNIRVFIEQAETEEVIQLP